MKKFLIVLAAIMAIFAIAGCNNGTTGGGKGNTPGGNTPGGNTPGNTPSGDLVIDDADEIGALLAAANWGGSLDHVTATNNVAHFNIPASGSTDNNGFKLSFPEAAVGAGYLELQVSFKVVEVTTLEAGKNAKIGFKSGSGGPDVEPYDDHELVFGTIDTALDEELTQAFSLYQPNKLPGNALWFSHNAYGDGAKAGSARPVNYKLEITKMVFVGGEAESCCDDCEDGCADCDAGECVDNCGTDCCLPPFTLDSLNAISGGITLGVGGSTAPVFNSTTKVVKVTQSSSSLFYFSWADASFADAFTSAQDTDFVKVTYACFIEAVEAKVTVKSGANSWTDVSPASYPTLVEGPSNSFQLLKSRIGASANGLSFQDNSGAGAIYHVKILGVEIVTP
jgi:hypothetical protein